MCDFLVHDWIQEQTVAHTFLPPFVNANGRLGYSFHIKTFEIQKLCYQGNVKSHLCVCCIVTRHFVTCSLRALKLANKKTSLMVTSSYRSMPESSLLSIIFMTSFFFRTHSAYTGDDLFTRKINETRQKNWLKIPSDQTLIMRAVKMKCSDEVNCGVQ